MNPGRCMECVNAPEFAVLGELGCDGHGDVAAYVCGVHRRRWTGQLQIVPISDAVVAVDAGLRGVRARAVAISMGDTAAAAA